MIFAEIEENRRLFPKISKIEDFRGIEDLWEACMILNERLHMLEEICTCQTYYIQFLKHKMINEGWQIRPLFS